MRIGKPTTLSGWLIVAMLSALGLSQLITVGAVIAERRFVTAALHRAEAFRQVDAAVQFASGQAGQQPPGVRSEWRSRNFRLMIDERASVTAEQMDHRLSRMLADALRAREVAEVRVATRGARIRRLFVFPPGAEGAEPSVEPAPLVRPNGQSPNQTKPPLNASVRLKDGRWINATISAPEDPEFAPALAIAALISAIALTIALILVARRLTRPLERLTEAAEQIGRTSSCRTVPEDGPEDLRRVTRGFNNMALRVERMLQEQQLLLRAIGHDLRTPLSSLRIRLEFVDDPELRARMENSIAQIEQLTTAALEAARGGAVNEPVRRLDLASLVEALCDDAAEIGKPVRFDGAADVHVRGRSSELRRAIQNLIDNAIVHADGAEVQVRRDGDEACVVVADRGPGIPEAELSRVFEPFVRIKAASESQAAGHGLGLTIAENIATRHSGSLSLKNRPNGGLGAFLRLPAVKAPR